MSSPVSNRLIVALDVDSYDSACSLVAELTPHVGWFKIGPVMFTREGPRVCELVKQSGAGLFLDLKFHDIPNTVKGAVKNALAMGADMMTLHASGGPTMLSAARTAAEEVGKPDVILVAVTVLTHLSPAEFNATFASTRPVSESVVALARVAKEGKMSGVVASAQELPAIRKALGRDFVVVTPGIRLPDAKKDDQTRVVTPEQAIRDGADYLVVGRPIIAAADPVAACHEVLDRMESAVAQ
ncbi:MAG TPA: orotidine-5'-phosphate decarboxylase [Candidatus Krumholzibacteria bacterium]|nr:orotidine-5'-phosphate decarboxylase [Candidatus Krumholzibacteria bacterium]